MVKIFKFTDLIVWQKSHKLVLDIYNITINFPKEELFVLVSQLRRAAISITSNIAEGFGRKSNKEKVQFYFVSLGSIYEVENQIIIARDLGYLEKEIFNKTIELLIEVQKMLYSLIKKIKLTT